MCEGVRDEAMGGRGEKGREGKARDEESGWETLKAFFDAFESQEILEG